MIPGSRRANAALALLFGINFLNYIDRYVIAPVVPLIQTEFHLGDGAAGLVGSMFMIAFVSVLDFGFNKAAFAIFG